MMRSFRLLAAFMVTLFTFPLFAGEPVAATSQTIIKLWHSYRDAERAALEATVEAFNQSQKEIVVDVLFIPNEAFASKLDSAIPHGTGPDIFIFAHDRVGDWAVNQRIQAIDPYLQQLDGVTDIQDRFFDKTLEALTFENGLYGLPTTFKSLALFYNKKLIKEPPKTTDEMIALAKEHTIDAENRFGLVYEVGKFYSHAPWIFGFGGKFFDGHKAVLNTKEHVDAIKFMQKLINPEDPVVPKGIQGYQITSMFNEDKAAMVISGPWFLSEIGKNVDFGLALLPTVSATGKPAQPLLGAEAFLLSKTTTKPLAAVKVMNALTSDEAALIRQQQGHQTVANRAIYKREEVQNDAIITTFMHQMEQAVPMPNIPIMGLIWSPYDLALAEAINEKSTPEAALAKCQRTVEHYIIAQEEGQALKDARAKAAAAGERTDTGRFIMHISIIFGLLLLFVIIFCALRWSKTKKFFKDIKTSLFAYGYIAPTVISMGLVVFIPFVYAVSLAFFRYFQNDYYYIGLQNFADILFSTEYPFPDNYNFYYKLLVTIGWTVANLVITVAVGLALALILKDPLLKFKGIYRVLLIIPWAVPSYITAIIWRGMFDQRYGVINHIFGWNIDWWANTGTAFLTNLATNSWLGFPFMMVVALGALQSIPSDLYEAAKVDGATKWQQFIHITLPLLKPALFPSIILSTVWTFNQFNVIYLVSKGAPGGATDILISEAYRWAFERGNRYGYAAAYSIIIFLILLLYSQVTNRVTKAAEGAGK